MSGAIPQLPFITQGRLHTALSLFEKQSPAHVYTGCWHYEMQCRALSSILSAVGKTRDRDTGRFTNIRKYSLPVLQVLSTQPVPEPARFSRAGPSQMDKLFPARVWLEDELNSGLLASLKLSCGDLSSLISGQITQQHVRRWWCGQMWGDGPGYGCSSCLGL